MAIIKQVRRVRLTVCIGNPNITPKSTPIFGPGSSAFFSFAGPKLAIFEICTVFEIRAIICDRRLSRTVSFISSNQKT